MKRSDEPQHKERETSEAGPGKIIVEKLGRFADYTTPAMKELLSYAEGKRRVNGSPT